MTQQQVTIDGNEAAAYVAHKTNEVIAIYPITPSSAMGEWADLWSTKKQNNIWGTIPLVAEMQAEGGAAGAIHGALQTGALTTTFTASQGLLLMIPNMYKIAGELTSTVFHIAARSVAAQGLSIFGDHSDVMGARATGWGMLFANNVQEVMDMALIAQASTLKARVPLLHIFDGFRTSHEIMKVNKLSDDTIRSMIDDDAVRAHRQRGLSPDRPMMRGTAQNPDVFFQARETVNPYYLATPSIVQEMMNQFAELTGRQYNLFDYVGAPDAERVVILMGSGSETVEETVNYLVAQGEKVGMLKVRLYRPFSAKDFVSSLPTTVKVIATLDRTKEPGSSGEPLYLDVMTTLTEQFTNDELPMATLPKVVGGRYGLSSKEFTPAMVKAVFDNLSQDKPKNHFTIGIIDDVTNSHLDYDSAFDIEADDVVRAMFWGLGADGTVGANKNSIKIIGEETPNYAQGYFVFDSKKSGARTVSHLRFGPRPIQSTYLINQANFIAVHQFGFLTKYDVLGNTAQGATFLLNSPYAHDEVWEHLPRTIQQTIIDKQLNFYVIDAYAVAKKIKLGVRINTIMQTCFFAISGVLPQDEAIVKIKEAIEKTYGKRGKTIVQQNYDAVDASLAHMFQVDVPTQINSTIELTAPVPEKAPAFVKQITAEMIAGRGDMIPVSALPIDGTYPTGTTQWEKRNLALEVPVWDEDLCIQCGKCVMVCPHAVIRSKVYDEAKLADAPETFKSTAARWKGLNDQKYTLQVAVEDCTACQLCIEVCPVKDKQDPNRRAINMEAQPPLLEQERANWDFFLDLPDTPTVDDPLKFNNVKNVQLLQPLFEFSGACAGCGETPYLKLMTQLFGDRTIIANATGCSSIYGGNLPTTPWTKNKEGRGPVWSNSLFEDNAEFGMGMRLTIDKQLEYARELLTQVDGKIDAELRESILNADQSSQEAIDAQRERIEQLKAQTADSDDPAMKDLHDLADILAKKTVWIVGGDGWAYDIGYGGLDHVLASGRNVNVLVLDTEVYSNTGGQASKSTPLGAVAKFAMGGKPLPKKDLGMIAMSYEYIYVAQVAMGANDAQTIKAFLEAEAYDGPSLIIAYSQCIAHGIDMAKGMEQQKLAVQSGHWPLYRFNPTLFETDKSPFSLDCRKPNVPLSEYHNNENRFRMLKRTDSASAEKFLKQAQKIALSRWDRYLRLSKQWG
ncbi:pyruvate:ferredoxin (flavodoxin) oxidoreductase [Anaerolineales bacterium HSG24]|nr:pyruvate:ferredoxin (flavodoxin) oxidoreductase [Anaerolineales bacterium HSG24]